MGRIGPTRGNPPCPVTPPWCRLVEAEATLVAYLPPLLGRWCLQFLFCLSVIDPQLGGFGIELVTWLEAEASAGWVGGADCGGFRVMGVFAL